MEILRLVAGGRADKQIAAGLGISEETVAYHLRVLYDLRAVRCRAAFVASLAHLLPEG
jgi:DNA-binding CsgD family transcriptional regulator